MGWPPRHASGVRARLPHSAAPSGISADASQNENLIRQVVIDDAQPMR
jgi:hypothetical protein